MSPIFAGTMLFANHDKKTISVAVNELVFIFNGSSNFFHRIPLTKKDEYCNTKAVRYSGNDISFETSINSVRLTFLISKKRIRNEMIKEIIVFLLVNKELNDGLLSIFSLHNII
jgi:hypothetical protein